MHSSSLTLTDPTFQSKEKYSFFDRFALHFIRDERDLPFIYLCLKLQFVMIPIAISQFFYFKWWIAIPYLLIQMLVFVGPFVLMLHNTSHRKLFKRKYEFMNHYIPWVLGPFCGETPETYFCHHIGMHHVENNLPPDLSTTMIYQRDNWKHFALYFAKFFFFSLVDLPRYFWERGRAYFIKRLFMGEVSFIVMCILLSFVNWKATLMVFVLPFIIVRFSMMAGNWAQHAFIDPKDPANNYKNSITCINTIYNKRCFNDGYHIGHHIRPSMHWTDMPNDFLKNKQKYIHQEAIIFEGIDFFFIWFLLMTKNYSYLASKFVDLSNRFNGDKAATIAFLKQRVAQVSKRDLENYK